MKEQLSVTKNIKLYNSTPSKSNINTRIDLALPTAGKMLKDAEIEIITNESISITSKIDEKTAEIAAKAG